MNSEDVGKKVWTEFRCINQCHHCSISSLLSSTNIHTYITPSLYPGIEREGETDFSFWMKWNTMIGVLSAISGCMCWEKDKHVAECMITNDMAWWEDYIRGWRKRQYHQWSPPHQYRARGVDVLQATGEGR